jgi:hypothetical protein
MKYCLKTGCRRRLVAVGQPGLGVIVVDAATSPRFSVDNFTISPAFKKSAIHYQP